MAVSLKNVLAFVLAFVLFPAIVLAINTEALTADQTIADNQASILAATGQYGYVAPQCDPAGCYVVNHIEKWTGSDKPIVGYQVVYTKTDGSSKADDTIADNSLSWDWTAPVNLTTTTL